MAGSGSRHVFLTLAELNNFRFTLTGAGTQRAYAALQGLSNGIGSPRWNPAVTKQAVASLVCFISNCLQHLAQGPIYERAVLCSLLSQSTNVLHRLCSLQQGTREEASKSFKLVDTLCCGLNLLCKLQITRTDTLALMTTNAPNSKLPQDFPAQAIDSLPPFSSHALAAIRACILLIGELDTAVPDVLLHISTALPMLCSWAVGGDLQQPVHAQIMPAQAKATCSSYIHADTAVQAAALTALLRMASEVNCVQLLRQHGLLAEAVMAAEKYSGDSASWTAGSSPHSQDSMASVWAGATYGQGSMGIGSMCLSLADTLLSHKISSLKQEEATQIISSLTVLLCNAHCLQPGDIELVLAVTSKLAAQLSTNSVQAQVGASHDQRMPVAKTDINGQAYAPKLPMGFGSLVTPSQRPSASPMVSRPAGQLSQQQSSNTHAVFNSAAGKVPVSPYHAKAVVRQLTAKLAAGGQPPLLRLVPLLAALATGKHESMLQWLRRSSGSLAAPLQQGFSAAQLPAGNSSNTNSRGAYAVPEYSGIAASRQGISVPGGQAGSCTQVQRAWQGVEAAMVQAEQQALQAMQALMGTAADAPAASGAAGSCLQALALCAGDASYHQALLDSGLLLCLDSLCAGPLAQHTLLILAQLASTGSSHISNALRQQGVVAALARLLAAAQVHLVDLYAIGVAASQHASPTRVHTHYQAPDSTKPSQYHTSVQPGHATAADSGASFPPGYAPQRLAAPEQCSLMLQTLVCLARVSPACTEEMLQLGLVPLLSRHGALLESIRQQEPGLHAPDAIYRSIIAEQAVLAGELTTVLTRHAAEGGTQQHQEQQQQQAGDGHSMHAKPWTSGCRAGHGMQARMRTELHNRDTIQPYAGHVIASDYTPLYELAPPSPHTAGGTNYAAAYTSASGHMLRRPSDTPAQQAVNGSASQQASGRSGGIDARRSADGPVCFQGAVMVGGEALYYSSTISTSVHALPDGSQSVQYHFNDQVSPPGWGSSWPSPQQQRPGPLHMHTHTPAQLHLGVGNGTPSVGAALPAWLPAEVSAGPFISRPYTAETSTPAAGVGQQPDEASMLSVHSAQGGGGGDASLPISASHTVGITAASARTSAAPGHGKHEQLQYAAMYADAAGGAPMLSWVAGRQQPTTRRSGGLGVEFASPTRDSHLSARTEATALQTPLALQQGGLDGEMGVKGYGQVPAGLESASCSNAKHALGSSSGGVHDMAGLSRLAGSYLASHRPRQ